jgi:hypothetical protein
MRSAHRVLRKELATCAVWAVAMLAIVVVLVQRPAAETMPSAFLAMQTFLSTPTVEHEYSGTRRLEASGKGQQGWVDVQTEFTRRDGLRYTVIAEGGSGYIRSHVLRTVLDEEQRILAAGGSAATLSPRNYKFTPEGVDQDGLAIVRIEPRTNDPSLVDGRMFLTADGDLRRVEGRLVKNPSFWVSRVDLVRTYERIDGVSMPVSLVAQAQLRLFGSSSLQMTYHYAQIDQRPIATE